MMTKQRFLDLLIVAFMAVLAVFGVVAAMSMQQYEEPNNFYVAMGDSIAAGGENGDTLDTACGRSDNSYPHKIATELGLELKNIACGGAKLTQGIISVQNENEDSQLDTLFALPAPGIITLTIGINDVNLIGQFANECMQGLCGTGIEKNNFKGTVKEVERNLRTVLSRIENHYQDKLPSMYVTGYYQFLPRGGSLPDTINESERRWIGESHQLLTDAIQNVASEYRFVTYVPISYSGHELYTDDPWIYAADELNPLHPKEAGYKAIAQQVISAIRAKK